MTRHDSRSRATVGAEAPSGATAGPPPFTPVSSVAEMPSISCPQP
jgi:hypothetical protein